MRHTALQGGDCTIPGNPSAGSCFFDYRAFPRINAAEVASGKAPTPSFTTEDVEFAILEKHLGSVLSDLKALGKQVFGGTCWPQSLVVARAGGSTSDLISPLSGSPKEPFVWVELTMSRLNIPAPAEVSTPRLQKKLSALQEAFEQLLLCK